ncbi:hypothetical protein [Spirosoma sp.]|uniref:hypothetical protein n=1 Tax=Spirosoma sp. TaxID=1899569 RepID=UPI003B3A1D46
MNEFFRQLTQLNSYLWILPVVVGLFRWNRLTFPLKVYVIGAACSTLIVYLCLYLKLRNLAFYCMPLLGSVIFGLMFQDLLKNVVHPTLIRALVACIWVSIISYILKYSIHDFQLRVTIPYDIIMLLFSVIYLVHRLKYSSVIADSLFYIVLIFFVDFAVNLFLDLMSNYLKTYFSDNFMHLLWNKILPVFNLIKISLLSITFWSVKPKLPSLDKIPSFEK